MNRTPIIAIPASKVSGPSPSVRPHIGANQLLVKFLSDLGAIAVLISETDTQYLHSDFVDRFDGLLLPSGPDVSPSLYGCTSEVVYSDAVAVPGKPYLRPINYQSTVSYDNFECALFRSFYKLNKPILGICRGMQIMNVALGGSLHQENPDLTIKHDLHTDHWIPYHQLIIEKTSLLYQMIKKTETVISSIHHQSIQRLASELKVTARAPDGCIEAVEALDRRFIVGLQGHPEKITDNFPEYTSLFREFVRLAGDNRVQN